MSRIAFIVVLMLYVAQTPITGQSPRPITKPFEQELKKWMDYFHIPGLAVGVKKGEELIYENYFGHANIATKQKVQATTVFPIASVTKTLTVLTILNLVEEGTLSLNASILDYLPQSKLPESVQVQHLLSHTSEGIPGETYIYSTRIGLLKSIVEQVTAQTFEEYIQENLLDKLGLASTHFLTENTIAALGDTLAKPYFFFGSTEPGIYEPGFSVTSGLAMTMRDLMRFDRMLDNGTVCSKSMKSKAFTPFQSKKGEAFPYGLGIFVQDIGGASVVWSYGQYDCFSSLYLKVLDSDLTLVLLANNNLMSDPARLINGDIRYSLFARAFFRHFLQEDGATKQAWMSRATQKGEGYMHQELDDLYAIALARSFMAEGYAIEEKRAIDVMKLALSLEPNLEERASLPVLHCLIRLMGLNHAQTFDEAIDRVSTILRKRYPKDPYALYYQAAFRQHQGKTKEAIRLLETLVQLENHQIWWYTIDAHYQLGTFYRELNPAKARTHFERIVAIGWDIGGKVKLSKYILNEMNGKE